MVNTEVTTDINTKTKSKTDTYHHLRITLAEKVAFLSQARHYPEKTQAVRVIETHMAWVFLTDRFAYKLKKPVFLPHQDFSTIDARWRDHKRELTLNRRLAGDIYVDIVPLTVNKKNAMRLGSKNPTCEWLLKMHRISEADCFTTLAAAGKINHTHAHIIGRQLGEFYRSAKPILMNVYEYRQRFIRHIDENLCALRTFGRPRQFEWMQGLCDRQLMYIDAHGNLFDQCLYRQRVIEGHGDLRPEHVYFNSGLRIIDCLEFCRDLRLLDFFDDLAYLSLECERLGLADIGDGIIATVADICAQPVPERLLYFYKSYRAAIRAKLAILHLRDLADGQRGQWYRDTDEYLELAEKYLILANG